MQHKKARREMPEQTTTRHHYQETPELSPQERALNEAVFPAFMSWINSGCRQTDKWLMALRMAEQEHAGGNLIDWSEFEALWYKLPWRQEATEQGEFNLP